MELKRVTSHSTQLVSILLIVPYGIETNYLNQLKKEAAVLLIVPYGIETLRLWRLCLHLLHF